jgi:pSer/pThr/pTyr-binding forkhead associated (FHA) protein
LKLNGKRISTQTLSNSDVIQIANIEFTFIK